MTPDTYCKRGTLKTLLRKKKKRGLRLNACSFEHTQVCSRQMFFPCVTDTKMMFLTENP